MSRFMATMHTPATTNSHKATTTTTTTTSLNSHTTTLNSSRTTITNNLRVRCPTQTMFEAAQQSLPVALKKPSLMMASPWMNSTARLPNLSKPRLLLWMMASPWMSFTAKLRNQPKSNSKCSKMMDWATKTMSEAVPNLKLHHNTTTRTTVITTTINSMTKGTTRTRQGITIITSSSNTIIMTSSSKTTITMATSSNMLTTKDMIISSNTVIKAITKIKDITTTRVIRHRITTSISSQPTTIAKIGPTLTSSREGTQHLWSKRRNFPLKK